MVEENLDSASNEQLVLLAQTVGMTPARLLKMVNAVNHWQQGKSISLAEVMELQPAEDAIMDAAELARLTAELSARFDRIHEGMQDIIHEMRVMRGAETP